MASGDHALIVSAGLAGLRSQQALLWLSARRKLSEIADRRIPPTSRGWFVLSNSHLIARWPIQFLIVYFSLTQSRTTQC
jgi:hypothetical protein